MKSLVLVLVTMVLWVGVGYGVQPVRKPFLQLTLDGKTAKNGDIITVKPGQKLVINVEMEGGRRDFCKFPDTYADIAGTAQILQRGKDGITYELNGQNAVWKLLSEDISFVADNFMQVKSSPNQPTAELLVSNLKFDQTQLKITVRAVWQYSHKDQVTREENTSEAMIYFKAEGASDVWFASKNIQATGIANEQIKLRLQETQLVCDSIERSFFRLNFGAVQQSIRDLQASVNTLKSVIDSEKSANPSYKTSIVFNGLPSDQPLKDIVILTTLKTEWTTFETLAGSAREQIGSLQAQASKENTDALIETISALVEWEDKLPATTFELLPRYIPEFTAEKMRIPDDLRKIAAEKRLTDYSKSLDEAKAFLVKKIELLPEEIQKISAAQSRIQAVRLFDGMLRSYFSSIVWAEWEPNAPANRPSEP